MNSYSHPNPGCDLVGHGSSNHLLVSVLAAIVGGAAGLLLVPIVSGVIILATVSLGITRVAQWFSGYLSQFRTTEPSLSTKL